MREGVSVTDCHPDHLPYVILLGVLRFVGGQWRIKQVAPPPRSLRDHGSHQQPIVVEDFVCEEEGEDEDEDEGGEEGKDEDEDEGGEEGEEGEENGEDGESSGEEEEDGEGEEGGNSSMEV